LRTTSKSRLLFKYTSNIVKFLSLMAAYNSKQKEALRGCNNLALFLAVTRATMSMADCSATPDDTKRDELTSLVRMAA
jgi:hypothetical protein